MKAPIATMAVLLVAFLFCAFASAYFSWHSSVTGPATAVCAVGLIACGVWLNRSAGDEDGEEDEGEGS